MELSWATLFRVGVAALGTYVVLPLVLVARDFILWWLLDKFVLTSELHQKVRAFAEAGESWNRDIARKSNVSYTSEGVKWLLDGKEVGKEEWILNSSKTDNLAKQMQDLHWYIQKRSNLVGWLLKYYKQDETNPVSSWLQREADRAKRRYDEKNAEATAKSS